MKHYREYEIAWMGMKVGLHTFVYELDQRFLVNKEAPEEFKDLKAKVTLSFDKHESFFMLRFDVDGVITLPCDRCGDDFPLTLWDEFRLLIKLTGNSPDDVQDLEDEADVTFLPRTETVIDVSDWLYEFIMLSIPIHKVHPNDAKGVPTCNPEALKLLNALSESDLTPENIEEETPKNNIWKDLQKLKTTTEETTVTKKK